MQMPSLIQLSTLGLLSSSGCNPLAAKPSDHLPQNRLSQNYMPLEGFSPVFDQSDSACLSQCAKTQHLQFLDDTTFDPQLVDRSNTLIVKLKPGVNISEALPLLSTELNQHLSDPREILPGLFELKSDQESSAQELQLHTSLHDSELIEYCNVEIGVKNFKPTGGVPTRNVLTRQQLVDSGYSDEFIHDQWPLVAPQKHASMEAFGANVLKAHELSTGRGAVGAVIDSGRSAKAHEDVISRMHDISFGDHVDYCIENGGGGHGMFVTGMMVASANNDLGIAGVAPEAKVSLLKGLSACNDREEHPVLPLHILMLHAAGFEINGLPTNPSPAKVINLSLGADAPCPPYFQEVVDAIEAAGVNIVVAAGNSRFDARLSMPANCDTVTTVGASDYVGQMTEYSNFGPRIDLMAPGGDPGHPIVSLSNVHDHSYFLAMGTSMAAPMVSGAMLLMRSVDPDLTPQEVRDILSKTSVELPFGCHRGEDACGTGMLDTDAAVTEAANRKFERLAFVNPLDRVA